MIPQEATSITIESTDSKFLVKLIDWLNKQKVKENSTIIKVKTITMPVK